MTKTEAAEKVICENRRARHDYDLGEQLEAGIVLGGSEVKACREGKAQLKDAYVRVLHGECFLIGAHIAEYRQAGHFNHELDRTRKLLLHRKEIDRLQMKTEQQGLAVIPLKMFFKTGRVKVLLAVAKGRTHEDRRHAIKEREVKRELQRIVRSQRR